MKWEYLLLNLFIIAGPLALSFDKKVRYFRQWKYALLSAIIVLLPYIVWDVRVTGKHWWFNDDFITGIQLAGVPVEEWMFFITVPFAVLFIWQIFAFHTGNPVSPGLHFIKYLVLLLCIPGVVWFASGREYTGLVFLAVGITGMVDILMKTDIFSRKNTYFYLAIVTGLNVVFNGYLTGRPIVMYDETYQLGIRIFTIPLEDFIYGYSLILLNTILFEKFKEIGKNG